MFICIFSLSVNIGGGLHAKLICVLAKPLSLSQKLQDLYVYLVTPGRCPWFIGRTQGPQQ